MPAPPAEACPQQPVCRERVTNVSPIDDLPALDRFSPEYLSDPHAYVRRLRESSNAARSLMGVEFLTYEACEQALLDARFRSGAIKVSEFLGDSATLLVGSGRNLLTSEGADHDVVRRAVSPWFTPRRVAELTERTRALVDSLLDRVDAAGECDFVSDVARIVPGAVFCWMIGAPEADGVRLATWSETLIRAFRMDPDDMPGIETASAELGAYVDQFLASKRADPADDVGSMLLAAEARGDITRDDVHSILIEMLSASTDNTQGGAALQLLLLLEHPDQWELLVQRPDLVPNAVEECGRYEGPVSATPILNEEDADLAGLELPGGSLSWLLFSAAHRDPAVFDEPDRFDITRDPPKGQLSFGVGRHYCLGAALARMELRVLLTALVERWCDPMLVGEVEISRAYGPSPATLPVRFTPT
jgi:cytochrome P450